MNEGYPPKTLLFLKERLHHNLIRKQFKKIIHDYKNHEDSKPQRIRMKIIQEVISSETIYERQLTKPIK